MRSGGNKPVKRAAVAMVPTAPDGGWGWFVVIGSVITHFLVPVTTRSFGIFFQSIMDKFDASAALTAWIPALANAVRMLLGPLAGFLCEQYSCRTIVIIGALFLFSGAFITSFATNLIAVYTSFGIIYGIGGGLTFAPAYLIVSRYFDKKRGRAMGLSTVGTGIGSLVLVPLFRLMIDYYSFSGSMLVISALMLNVLVSGALYRPLIAPSTRRTPPAVSSDTRIVDGSECLTSHSPATSQSPVTSQSPATSQSPVTSQSPDVQSDIVELNSTLSAHTSELHHNHESSALELKLNDAQITAASVYAQTSDRAPPDAAYEQRPTPRHVAVSRDTQSDIDDSPAEERQTRSLLNNNNNAAATPAQQQQRVTSASSRTRSRAVQCCASLRSYVKVLFDVRFLLYGAQIVKMAVCIQSFLTFLPLACVERGVPAGRAALILALFGVSDTAGRFAFGFLFDARPVRRLGLRVVLHSVMGSAMGVLAVSVAFARSFTGFLLVTLLFGLMEGGMHSQRTGVLGEVVTPDRLPAATGFVIFFQGVGNIYGPVLLGYIRDVSKTYAYSYICMGVFLVTACSIFQLYLIINRIFKFHSVTTHQKQIIT